MDRHILAIDQSTSATKAILFDNSGGMIGRSSIPHKQHYPQTGFVEHDAKEIFVNTLEAMKSCVSEHQVSEKEIAAVAITNQRETALVWNKKTGEPIANAAVWQCLRGEALCAELSEKGHGDMVKETTGLVLDPYFSASKIRWLLDNVPGAREAASAGELLFGTIDSWLVWKLTAGQVHVTDFSNACRTLLLDIHSLQWSEQLFDLFDIPIDMAPELACSDTVVGTTQKGKPFEREVPIAGLFGDSHAALFGETCFDPGTAKATYGTGSSIMMNIGETPRQSEKGIVTSVGYSLSSGTAYVFEGNIHSSGATLQWLSEEVGLIENPAESSRFSQSVTSTEGVYLVPAFVGLGAPYWDSEARALITGMTRSTRKAHIVRAAQESIVYQVFDLIEVMSAEAGLDMPVLHADGGPTRDEFLMQFQADILRIPVRCAVIEEVSALGSAYAAGLAVGMWTGTDELKSLTSHGRLYEHAMNTVRRDRLIDGWKTAVGRARWKP